MGATCRQGRRCLCWRGVGRMSGYASASPGDFVCHSAKKCMGGYLLRGRALHMRTSIGGLLATETCASHAHVHREVTRYGDVRFTLARPSGAFKSTRTEGVRIQWL